MRIIAFSDVHNRQARLTDKMPNGDVLFCAGDATGNGQHWEVQAFMDWMGQFPHPHKIFIAGNHDWLFEKEPGIAKKYCEKNGITLLNDSGIQIDGVNFWGSPITREFNSWAFNRFPGPDIQHHWNMIPENVDVLGTHGPPFDILDKVSIQSTMALGDYDLMERLKIVKPVIHLFGHIHGGYGQLHQDGTSYYNVSVCDERYCPINPITVIEFDPKESKENEKASA